MGIAEVDLNIWPNTHQKVDKYRTTKITRFNTGVGAKAAQFMLKKQQCLSI